MKHLFDVAVAEKVGINAAIILENIAFWCKTNEANGRGYHDGRYWTYNSKKAFHELFPYLSIKQIGAALQKLVDAGYIVKGSYNDSVYDRTLWYAITDEGKSIVQYGNLECDKRDHSTTPKGTMEEHKRGDSTYTDINTDINADINTERKKENTYMKLPCLENLDTEKMDTRKENTKRTVYADIISEYTSDPELRDILFEFIKMRKLIKSPMTDRALRSLLKKLDELASTKADKIATVEQSIVNNWKSVYPLKKDAARNQRQTEYVEIEGRTFDKYGNEYI